MHIEQLSLTGFRSYAEATFTFGSHLNGLFGPNGSGKTNLLEALHFLCLTKGFHPDRDAVRQGDRFFNLDATGEWGEGRHSLKCHYQPGVGKRMILDGQPLPRLSQHIGQLPVVVVLPDDTDLIRGGSSLRRRWLDGAISQTDPRYLEALLHYERALKQRNALLDAFRQQGVADPGALEPWDYQLAQHGPYLQQQRRLFIQDFEPVFMEMHRHICGGVEAVTLRYAPEPVLATEADVQDLLQTCLRADLAAGRSTRGVHKEDLDFLLKDHPLRSHGSQGQQKTFVLALRLALAPFLHKQTGRAPILLLDDLFDKLDPQRTHALASLLAQHPGQVFITHPDEERLQKAFAGTQQSLVLCAIHPGA
ncbi:MAG: DNA replication and repair protein RecF [Bacteroidetes bacterium]|nr:DNA replication and repair protein RecF [Bacteroidota bacterium]